ncbi:MAG: translation initiation factor IF-2 [Prevotellaceae bacterium]|jgi:translation initiation factor IF-2|nr:translation initiation factor IF-2 [Prevotellaceae bacterium]
MSQANIRISKVVKEFNIGISTLVDFLNKKGIEVDANPNAKISSEAYALAAKEFGSEHDLKEAAKKVNLKGIRAVQEDVSLDDSKQKEVEDPEEEKEITIKVTTVEAPSIKIVDRIDLDAASGKKKKAEKEKEEKKTVAKKAKTSQEEPAKETVKQEEPQKKKEEKPEEIKVEAEHLKGPKVIDKIDLDALNKKPKAKQKEAEDKPKKEVKKKKEEEKPTKEATPKAIEEKPADIKLSDLIADNTESQQATKQKEAEFIPTKIEKLSGPTIVEGMKVDLSQFATKKENNSSTDKEKKKRKRIKKDKKVNIEASVSDAKKEQSTNAGKNKKNNKPNFKPVRQKVDEEAVQRQVKETLARLTAGKGKTKSSKYRREKRNAVSQRITEEQERQIQQGNTLEITEFVTVNELATMMDAPVTKVIEACMNLGLMVSINQRLDAEALTIVAEEFGYKVNFVSVDIQDAIKEEEDSEEDLQPRPPVVTVMGHVDHGKTSLLDYIRKANVIAGEAGGITQHIGAYNVKMSDGRRITFLDTPGHEAFTAMRARGAKITDVAIIIVAADDAVMPQTKEAINHAMAAGVPMVFAINKIDKPGADSEKIKEQLAQMNLLVEDWGGKYQSQEISAKKGLNVEKLLEKVLLEADLLELKANPDKNATGSVIESSLDKGRGYVATVLVQNGTLKVGDVMLSGSYTGRVKAMFNERGQRVEKAGPSTPVLVLGLNGAPAAGETFNVLDDEREAKDLANKREQLLRIQGLRTQKHITLEEIGRRIAIGNFKELNIIVKGDVDGSIEALSDSLIKLSNDEVQVNVIHKAVGAISESDVTLAAASNAIIIGFQVRPSASARRLAEQEEIEIRLYSVIYDAINEVKDGIEGMLAPEVKEEITASVEVLETFKISKVGTIAGCMVREGKITRNSKVRVIRDGIVVYTGTLGSLKRFKDDVKEVNAGYECGLNIENFNDIKVGDIVEAYEMVEVKRNL